jgi:hypothetical protein
VRIPRQQLLGLTVVVTLAFMVSGCGGGPVMLRTEGQLLKGGEPFIPEEGQNIQITFVPITKDGKPAKRTYYADVDQETGIFVPDGAQKNGMPPGKYRVAVALMKKKVDLFNGKFDEQQSPFVVDVDEDTTEIIIDLDKTAAEQS